MGISRIAIVCNLKDKNRSDDLHEEYDEIETLRALKDEIEGRGFKVSILEQNEYFPAQLAHKKPDLVLNIAEGRGSGRSRESQVPCILESLGIPYSGSDPVSIGITLDKYLTNLVLRDSGLPVPRAFSIEDPDDIDRHKEIFAGKDLWIVKPRWEGSSKGIHLDSVVCNAEEIKKEAAIIWQLYSQPAIVEEFLSGEEITVGVCGNGSPYILGMMRISPRRSVERFVYSIEEKRNWEDNIVYEGEDAISEEVKESVTRNAIEVFRTIPLRDVARIDFRLDCELTPRIIDVNPLPGLSPRYSDLMLMSRLSGCDYSGLITRIMTAVFERCGEEYPQHRLNHAGCRSETVKP